MVKKLAEYLAQRVSFAMGNTKNIEIYIYGLQIIINTLISIGSILLIGLFTGKLSESIIFLCCYCSIRAFSGGYHADTNEKCIVFFIMAYLAAAIIINRLPHFSFSINIIILVIVNLAIGFLSPVDTSINPISNDKKKPMKRKAIIITISLSFVIGLLLYFESKMANWGIMGLIWITVVVLLGKISNITYLRRDFHEKN